MWLLTVHDLLLYQLWHQIHSFLFIRTSYFGSGSMFLNFTPFWAWRVLNVFLVCWFDKMPYLLLVILRSKNGWNAMVVLQFFPPSGNLGKILPRCGNSRKNYSRILDWDPPLYINLISVFWHVLIKWVLIKKKSVIDMHKYFHGW